MVSLGTDRRYRRDRSQERADNTSDRRSRRSSASQRSRMRRSTFDPPSALSVRWLNANLTPASVEFKLLEVRRSRRGFAVTWHKDAPFVRSRLLPLGAAVSPNGRAYQVLVPGERPVLWHVGSWVFRRSAFALRARLSGTSPPFRTRLERGPVFRAFFIVGSQRANG